MPSFRSFRTGIRPIPWHKVGRLSIADVSCHSVGTAGISSHPVNQTWVSSAWRICLAPDLAWSISSIIHHYTFRTHPARVFGHMQDFMQLKSQLRSLGQGGQLVASLWAAGGLRGTVWHETLSEHSQLWIAGGFFQGIYHRNFGPFHSQVLNLWGFPLPLEVTQLGLIGRVEDCSILRT